MNILRGRRRAVEAAAAAIGVVVCIALIPFTGDPPPATVATAQPITKLQPSPAGDHPDAHDVVGTPDPGAAAPVAKPAADPTASACRDDGRSGRRIEALYVHGSAQRSRYTKQLTTFRTWLDQMDQAFVRAAQVHSGGVRHPRYLRDDQCRAVVRDVTIEQDAMENVDTITAAIKRQGFVRTDRKYIVWYDAKGCGVGFGNGGNDDPSWYNLYNFGPHYAAIGTDCWGWSPTLHELLHTLGAVQANAPHGTENGHCWDDEDVMCYDDGSLPKGGLSLRCPEDKGDEWAMNQIDCNGDDYFNTRPKRGSYLATHWNVADSAYLYKN